MGQYLVSGSGPVHSQVGGLTSGHPSLKPLLFTRFFIVFLTLLEVAYKSGPAKAKKLHRYMI